MPSELFDAIPLPGNVDTEKGVVRVPEQLSRQERELYEQLRALGGKQA